mmetsp:Transcript_4915/g.14569  ORF Transcript_4915/g.14569 Transcript_4915/m.14569 type:complete len:268 (-) Transcript_4915:22-825(-)
MRRRSLVAATHLLVAARGLSGVGGGDARFRAKLATVVGKRVAGFKIVIEDCSDVANAASILRTADAFGVPELNFVNERSAPHFDHLGEELRILSASASQWVRCRSVDTTAACLDELRADGFVSVASVMPKGDEACARLPSVDDAVTRAALGDLSRVALWLGTESLGLTEAAVEGCDSRIHIEHAGAVQSLNVASAAAILVADLTRLRATAPDGPPPALAAEDSERLFDDLLRQHEAWHVPQRRSRRRYAAAARGEIFRRRREQTNPS